MTDFTNVAALVAQGQALLDEIKGGKLAQIDASFLQKLVDVDAALAAKIAQANTAIAAATAPINDKIPRIQLSQNQELVVTSGSVPDGMVLRAGVTASTDLFVSNNIGNRSAGDLVYLAGMETDIKEQFVDFDINADAYYAKSFNVIRLDWDLGAGFSGSGYISFLNPLLGDKSGGAYPYGGEMTSASLIKVLSGGVSAHWGNGAELSKWRFCSTTSNNSSFSLYSNIQLHATTQIGSVLIALPVTTTGVIAHPKDLFKNLEFLGA